MIRLTPFWYDLFVKFLQFLCLPTLVASCYHLKSSLNFIEGHAEMNHLLAAVNGSRHFALMFAFADSALMILLALSSFFKTRILRRQYLTDRQNFFFKIVIFVNVFVCLSYCIFVSSTALNNEFNEEDFMKGMLKAMATYPGGRLKSVIDRIQIKYRCCGTEGYSDWFNFYWYNKHVGFPDDNYDDVPFSCCSDALLIPCIHIDLKEQIKYVGYFSMSNATVWQDGCLEKFKTVYKNSYTFLVTSSAVIVCLHLFLSIGDRLVQTADNCFVVQKRFQSWLFGGGPDLSKMFQKMQAESDEGFEEVSKESMYDRTVSYFTSSGSRFTQNFSVDQYCGMIDIQRNFLKRKSEEDVEFSNKKIKHVP